MVAENTSRSVPIDTKTIDQETYQAILSMLQDDPRCTTPAADEVMFFVHHPDGFGMTVMTPNREVVRQHAEGVLAYIAKEIDEDRREMFLSLSIQDLFERQITPETATGIIDRLVALRTLVPQMAEHFDPDTSIYVSVAFIDGHLAVSGADTVEGIAAVICFQKECADSVEERAAETIQ